MYSPAVAHFQCCDNAVVGLSPTMFRNRSCRKTSYKFKKM